MTAWAESWPSWKKRGIRDNTLIVYTSDNGFSCGQHGVWGKGNATFPLNLFDTAVKVPCISISPALSARA